MPLDEYTLGLIEEIVEKKITANSNSEVGTVVRVDNGEFMELDDTNTENVFMAVSTWSDPAELTIEELKAKHDPSGDGTTAIPTPPAP